MLVTTAQTDHQQQYILSVSWRHIRLTDLVSAKGIIEASQLIDIVSQPHQTMFQYTATTL